MSDWFNGQLSDSIAALDAGVSVNAEDRPHGAGEIGVLKTSAVSGGQFLPSQNKAVVQHERRLVAEPVQGDSILVSRMNTPSLVGESCYVSEAHPSLFLPDRLWQLKPKDRAKVSMRWLSFFLQSAAYRRYVEIHATGTSGSMKNLPKSKLQALPVSYPTLGEQLETAKILDSLDTAIRETEAIIAKLKAVKQGLLHDLLTRGIDANGEIRPPQTEAPHLYKDSPLGWIPKEWNVCNLQKAAEVIDPNPSHRNPKYVEDGFPFISTVEFIEPDTIITDTPRRVAEATVLDQERACNFRKGSIAFSRKGTIGATRVLPEGVRFALLDSLCVINARPGNDSRFLLQALRSHQFQHQSRNATMGVALPQLSIGRVRDLNILLPGTAEQCDIADRLIAASESGVLEFENLMTLQALKSGLMEDLLTGRVRVTPLLADAAQQKRSA